MAPSGGPPVRQSEGGNTLRVLIAACAVPAILLAACGVESRECEEPEKIEGIVRGPVTIGATCSEVLVQSTLVAAPGSIVTIEPGSTLRFATGAGLEVRNARLVAEGTALKPIVFQGRSKKPGAWRGIVIDNGRECPEFGVRPG